MPKKIVKCEATVFYEVEVNAISDEVAIEYVKDNLPEYETALDEIFNKFEIMSEEEMKEKHYLEGG